MEKNFEVGDKVRLIHHGVEGYVKNILPQKYFVEWKGTDGLTRTRWFRNDELEQVSHVPESTVVPASNTGTQFMTR